MCVINLRNLPEPLQAKIRGKTPEKHCRSIVNKIRGYVYEKVPGRSAQWNNDTLESLRKAAQLAKYEVVNGPEVGE